MSNFKVLSEQDFIDPVAQLDDAALMEIAYQLKRIADSLEAIQTKGLVTINKI